MVVPKNERAIEDELSTFPGKTVVVERDGNVYIKQAVNYEDPEDVSINFLIFTSLLSTVLKNLRHIRYCESIILNYDKVFSYTTYVFITKINLLWFCNNNLIYINL